jgi:hypothetical protein
MLVGARDLNPGPHGPELCDISFRNGENDRFLFEFVPSDTDERAIWRFLFARLLHELLHDKAACRMRELQELAADPEIAPARVLARHPRILLTAVW